MTAKSLVFLSLVCSLFAGCASQNGLFSSTTSLRQQYPNTIAYCQKWTALRHQFANGTKSLNTEDRADNLQNSKWNDWLAQQTLAIPQLHVDSRLTSLANEFVGLYRESAKLGRDLEELTELELAYKEYSNSWTYFFRSAAKGFGGDILGGSDELDQKEAKINEKQAEYNRNIVSFNVRLNDSISRRNHLRDQLTHDYGELADL